MDLNQWFKSPWIKSANLVACSSFILRFLYTEYQLYHKYSPLSHQTIQHHPSRVQTIAGKKINHRW